jgi:sRNA-binding regulator protein Hfq
MTQLQGFSDYKKEHYESSRFTTLEKSGEKTLFMLHGQRSITGTLMRQTPYDIHVASDHGEVVIPKVEVKCHAQATVSEVVDKLIKIDKTVSGHELGPIHAPAHRYFIKNKTLFPLIKERQVMLITLLEGEVIKGLLENFSRYDIEMRIKGGVGLTVLRHAVYDIRDKKGRCYLKRFQKEARDWKRSELYA